MHVSIRSQKDLDSSCVEPFHSGNLKLGIIAALTDVKASELTAFSKLWPRKCEYAHYTAGQVARHGLSIDLDYIEMPVVNSH